MDLFRPNDPQKALQRDLDKKRANHGKLAAQLASAETDIIASEAETRRLSSAGAENAAIDAAKAKERTCVDRRSSPVPPTFTVTTPSHRRLARTHG
jgi:hypothetical protein